MQAPMSDLDPARPAYHDAIRLWAKIRTLSLIVPLLLISASAVLIGLSSWVWRLSQHSTATSMTLSTVNQYARLVSDLETGQRGYLITGKASYLTPYLYAKKQLPVLGSQLNMALQGLPASRLIMARIGETVDNKIIEIDRTLELARNHTPDEAIALVRTDLGSALMEDVRFDVDLLTKSLENSIVNGQSEENKYRSKRDDLFFLLLGLALAASLASYWLLRQIITTQIEVDSERQRADRANAANREKSAFLANMSHEIRTPMNAIFGFAQLLKDTVQDEREKFYVQAIHQSGQVLLGLINDILDMSKIEAGRLELHPQPTDLNEAARSCEMLFSHMGSEKGLKMQMTLPASLPGRLMIDPLRLRQVIINLIGNALKYTEHGSVTTAVTLQPEGREKVTLRIAVTDTGVGIPREKLAVIFQPFIQLQQIGSNASAPGAGLGLSIVKRIVELMGGQISLQSVLGKGSNFIVTIPHIAIASGDGNYQPIPSYGPNDQLPPLKIVVVDDVELNRRLIEGLFLGTAHTVLLADGGLSGVELTVREQPDVVLMDIRMPDVDGVEALRRIREIASVQSTPVIAVTASSLLGEEGSLRRQFDGYLRKPVTREALVAELLRFFRTEIADESQPSPLVTLAELSFDELARWRKEIPQLCELTSRAALTLSTDELGELVAHLRKLAAEPDFALLAEQAEQIANASTLFDLSTLERLLKRLQDFCDELLGPEHQ